MSAIWGIVDLNQKAIAKTMIEKMKDPIEKYKIDQYEYQTMENAGMGCALQYITEESKLESLPYVDDNIFFTADVYLDNREELFRELMISEEEGQKLPDGTLMLKAYKKWGERFVEHLLGAFSCAVYDKKKEKVLLVADHTGSRCLSFVYKNGFVAFSTLLEPLKIALEQKVTLNQRWIHDFTAIEKLAISSECQETPYQEILQVAPGQMIKVTKAGMERQDYWEPTKSKKVLCLENDEAYKQAFLNLYQTIVKNSLRSCKETGVLLSGGLDSSSVACIAAKQLKEQGKALQAFTSIPDKEYGGRKNAYLVANETESVELIARTAGNIETTYYDLKGKDAWSDVDKLLDILELPYKSIQNALWMKEILGVAAEKGCKVVLNGQYGNTTVSFGDFFMQFYTLLEEHKYLTLKKEFSEFCQKNRLSRKEMIKQFLSTLLPNWYKKRKMKKTEMFSEVLAKKELIQKFHTKERFEKVQLNQIVEKNYSVKKYRPFMYYKEALSQIGIMETKSSLVNGVLIKDPTRDKRMIEFCLSLPPEQFVKKGMQRRLIRVYMKEYVPEKILDDSMRHKGMQSADMIFRLKKRWDEIYPELEEILCGQEAKEYLEQRKVEHLLNLIRVPDEDTNEGEITGSIYTAILFKYIRKNKMLKLKYD